MISVFGHKSPDTDSAGSAIIWAWYLNEIRKTPAEAVLLGPPNTEAAHVLRVWGFDTPRIIEDVSPGDEVVLVDTNNPGELVPSIHEARIVGIIDHHMLAGGLSTRTPIEVTIRPLACTATILHDLIGADLARAPRAIRGIMLSCILSDTLGFRSPTTTPHDRAVAEGLAAGLGLSIDEHCAGLFAARSDLSAHSDEAVLRMDAKKYPIDGHPLLISVQETTAPETLLARKRGLMAAMPAIARAEGAERVLLFIVDILREEATLLVPDEETRAIAEASFGTRVEGDCLVLPGIMSRKKQILPALRLAPASAA